MTENTEQPKSILGFLTEIEYPEEEILLYWDPVIAKGIHSLEHQIASTHGEDQDALVEEQEELIKKARETAIKVTIKGVPPRLKTDLAKKVLAEAKDKEYEEGSDLYNQFVIERAGLLNMQLQTVRIEANGESVSPPTEEDIKTLQENLPPTEFDRLALAIASLDDATELYQSEIMNETF